MEVLAKKGKGFLVGGIILLCLGAIALAVMLWTQIYRDLKWAINYGLLLLLTWPMGVAFLVLHCTTPSIMISRQGDTLYFPKDSCKISEIICVNYVQSRSLGNFWKYGRLIIQLADRTISVRMVQYVQFVHDKIYKLMMESKNEHPDYEKNRFNE